MAARLGGNSTLAGKLANFPIDNVILDRVTREHKDVKKILAELDTIPRKVLEHQTMKDVRVKITSRRLTDLDEMSAWKGKMPRGYTDSRYTWDTRPGTYHAQSHQVLLSIKPDMKKETSCKSTTLHEYGHAVHAEYLATEMQNEFAGIRDEDFGEEKSLPRWALASHQIIDYYMHYDEYFAESFGRYFSQSLYPKRWFQQIIDLFNLFISIFTGNRPKTVSRRVEDFFTRYLI